MQSRYYNPQWRRFINADDTSILLASVGQIKGANLFIYCGNNPVNMVDYSGLKESSSNELIGIVVMALSTLTLMEKSNSYKFLLSYDPVGFDYHIDKYGLIYSKIVFYNDTSRKYYVGRILWGDNKSWINYICSEANDKVAFGDNTVNSIVNVLSSAGQRTYNSSEEMVGGVMGAFVVSAASLGIFIIGEGIMARAQKSDYVTDPFFDSKSIYGFAGFEEIHKYSTKLPAIAKMKSNFKPRKYEEFMDL